MEMTDSEKLLAEYVRENSDAAFGELVSRYLNLVYSTAFRLVSNDAHFAQDVTQAVFTDLARMAHTLSPNVMLGGWLHRHTCFVASKTMRAERRRRARETEASAMHSQHDHSANNFTEIAPVLDEAINQLGADDRAAVALRFFEQRDLRRTRSGLRERNNHTAQPGHSKKLNLNGHIRKLQKLELFFILPRAAACVIVSKGIVQS